MQDSHRNSRNENDLVGLPLFANLHAQTPLKILRLPEVIAHVGLKRASIYQRIQGGSFPKPIPLGPRTVGWLEHEVQAWLTARISERGRKKRG